MLLLARCFFVKLGQILDQVAYRELEESSPQTWEKKDGLRPEDLLDESAGVQKSPLNKQTAGGCLDIAHICFVFFLFYSTIMIFTLADQLQRPTKQLTVLQIVSKKVLWMSSTFRCESSPPRYPHGDFWSWLLGLPGFFFEWLPFQENIHPLQQAGTAKCYKVVVMWKMGRRWLLQS